MHRNMNIILFLRSHLVGTLLSISNTECFCACYITRDWKHLKQDKHPPPSSSTFSTVKSRCRSLFRHLVTFLLVASSKDDYQYLRYCSLKSFEHFSIKLFISSKERIVRLNSSIETNQFTIRKQNTFL